MSSQEGDETALLVSRAQAGDEAAWARLVERYRPPLLSQADRQVPPSVRKGFDPEDVLQSSLLLAWKGLDDFEYSGKGSLDRWLSSIVRNNARSKLRELGRKSREELLETAHLREAASRSQLGPGELAAASDDQAIAAEKLRGLPDGDRELVLLHLRDELTFTAIGARLGLNRRTVSARCAAILRRLSRET